MNKTPREIVKNVILEMEKPFRLSDLLIRLERIGINDRAFILDILDGLIESGLVCYSEVKDDCWAYASVLAKVV